MIAKGLQGRKAMQGTPTPLHCCSPAGSGEEGVPPDSHFGAESIS